MTYVARREQVHVNKASTEKQSSMIWKVLAVSVISSGCVARTKLGSTMFQLLCICRLATRSPDGHSVLRWHVASPVAA